MSSTSQIAPESISKHLKSLEGEGIGMPTYPLHSITTLFFQGKHCRNLIDQMQCNWCLDRNQIYPCIMLRLTALKEVHHVYSTTYWNNAKKLKALCHYVNQPLYTCTVDNYLHYYTCLDSSQCKMFNLLISANLS